MVLKFKSGKPWIRLIIYYATVKNIQWLTVQVFDYNCMQSYLTLVKFALIDIFFNYFLTTALLPKLKPM